MFRAEVVTNHMAGCLSLGADGEVCMSYDRTANVRIWEGQNVLRMNTALCFSHRQQFLQAIRDAIMDYDEKAIV